MSITIIEEQPPSDWKNLQDQTARILREAGFDADTDVAVQLVRGTVDVDVWAEDKSQVPSLVYICECKHWSTAVPKTIVHAFRTVVSDSGANLGYLICSSGVQSGALDAAERSNIRPVTWEQFQGIFADRWFDRYFIPTLMSAGDRLAGYAEPIPCIPSMPEALYDGLFSIFKPYRGIGRLVLSLYLVSADKAMGISPSVLRKRFFARCEQMRDELPPAFFTHRSLRGQLEFLLAEIRRGESEIDAFYVKHGVKRDTK